MPQEEPPVKDCTAVECAFNSARSCHAGPITVGKDGSPACAAFLRAEESSAGGRGAGKVGRCGIYWCLRNREMICTAYGIKVRPWRGEPQCRSFKNRYMEGTN